jgi:rod shape-determining protein MreD
MRIAGMILAALVTFILQMKLAPGISVAGSAPGFMVILVVLLALRQNPVPAIITGFCLGLLLDLGNALHLGANAMAFSVVGYGVSHLGGGYLPEGALFKGILTCIAALLRDAVILAITTHFDIPEMLFLFARYSLLSGLYTALIAMIVFVLFKPLTRKLVRSGGGI